MTARDDYPTALFLVSDEPEPGRRFEHSVYREINAMFDEIDVLRSDLGLDRPRFDAQAARDAAAETAYPTHRGGHEGHNT